MRIKSKNTPRGSNSASVGKNAKWRVTVSTFGEEEAWEVGQSLFSHFFIHSAFGYYDVLDPSLGTGNTNRSTSSSASRSKGGEDEVAAETPTTHWIRNFSQCGPQVAGRALPTPACSRQAAPNPPPLTSCAVLFHTSLPNSFSPVGFQKLLVMSL